MKIIRGKKFILIAFFKVIKEYIFFKSIYSYLQLYHEVFQSADIGDSFLPSSRLHIPRSLFDSQVFPLLKCLNTGYFNQLVQIEILCCSVHFIYLRLPAWAPQKSVWWLNRCLCVINSPVNRTQMWNSSLLFF